MLWAAEQYTFISFLEASFLSLALSSFYWRFCVLCVSSLSCSMCAFISFSLAQLKAHSLTFRDSRNDNNNHGNVARCRQREIKRRRQHTHTHIEWERKKEDWNDVK